MKPDPAKRREYKQRYLEKHGERAKELAAAQRKRSHARHREKRLAAMRAKYLRDRANRILYAQAQYEANQKRATIDPAFAARLRTRALASKRKINARLKAERAARRHLWQVERACDACGRQFKLKAGNQRFCSKRCREHFNSQFFNGLRRTSGEISKEQWVSVMRYFGWQCAYCGKRRGPFQIDHVEPIVRGGTNDSCNLVPACRSCNASKHARNIVEFVLLKPLGVKLRRPRYSGSGYWKSLNRQPSGGH